MESGFGGILVVRDKVGKKTWRSKCAAGRRAKKCLMQCWKKMNSVEPVSLQHTSTFFFVEDTSGPLKLGSFFGLHKIAPTSLHRLLLFGHYEQYLESLVIIYLNSDVAMMSNIPAPHIVLG
jgi:hypothetical protein